MTTRGALDDRVGLLPLTEIHDSRGALVVAEIYKLCGFAAKRFYFLYAATSDRGAHAHKALRQVMIALAGRVEITVDSGAERKTFVLDSPGQALTIKPVIWRDIKMGEGAVLGVLASEPYDEADYIRDYDEFLAYVGENAAAD